MSPTTAHLIERELNELWKTDDQGAFGELSLQRHYTTNVVAFAPTPEIGVDVEEALLRLTGLHPGRYILLRAAAGEEAPGLQHEVSGHCVFDPDARKRICCDIVKLVARPSVLERLYGFTFSLLIPDLLSELWWAGDTPLRSRFFREVAGEVDRVWVDSSRFRKPGAHLAYLAGAWGRRFPDTAFADLNWLRLQRWRALIAELFDGRWSRFLGSIRRVTVEYGQGSQPMRSFLLICWMASRLGWQYGKERLRGFPAEVEFESPLGTVTAAMNPVPPRGPRTDRIYAVRIDTAEEQRASFSVARGEDPQQVVAHSEAEGIQRLSRVLYFEHLEPIALLEDGLSHWRIDDAWNQALGMLRSILHESRT